MLEVAKAIKSFLPEEQQADFVPPSDQLINISVGQLQDLITQAVEKAVQPLQEEISNLKATVASQGARVVALESTEEQDINRICLDIAQDRRRLAKLEHKEPEEDSPLLDELYKEMKAIGRKQTDFATAARMVKRSKRRMMQLKTAIALDQRFILIPSETHSQKLLIRLRECYKTA